MKKCITLFLLLMLLSVTLTVPVSAAEDTEIETVATQSTNGSMQPYADVIVTKYRYYQGKRQYRNWNHTRNCLVEPDLITYG